MARGDGANAGAVTGSRRGEAGGASSPKFPAAETYNTPSGALAGGLGDLISTTMPDELLRHNISDEELDVLCDPAREELWEIKWVALGALFSSLPSVADGLYRYAVSAYRVMTVPTLVQVVISVVALAVWGVLRFVVPQKTAKSNGSAMRYERGQNDFGTQWPVGRSTYRLLRAMPKAVSLAREQVHQPAEHVVRKPSACSSDT